jgi:allophanate hydrolase
MQIAGPLGISALRARYQAGELTPTEVVGSILDRIAARGDDHVWISRPDDAALWRAAAAVDLDQPLGGIPFAVKDNIDVAGQATTAGCPDFAYEPDESAVVVRRLIEAGALFVGKTNMDQFATGLSGTRSPYGACESVFGHGLIAGGSSSGSAVAVAAGLVSFALGTDTAGSGRVPAALNAIMGLKPTRGWLSTVGVVPACRSLDCVSIFASSVADAVHVAEVAGGAPAGAWDRAYAPSPLIPPGQLRLGLPDPSALDFAGDDAMRAAYLSTVDKATELAGSVVTIDIDPFLQAGELLYGGAFVAERLADLGPFLADAAHTVLPVTRTVIEAGAGFDAATLFRDQHRLRELAAAATRQWSRADALLLPTVPTTFTVSQMRAEPVRRNQILGRFTQFVNLLDLAALAVPTPSTVDGRPAGVSVIGPAFSDRTLAAFAAALTAQVAPAADLAASEDGLLLAVVGRHLRGETRHNELVERGATYHATMRTAPLYRLYHLANGAPGLVRTDAGAAIEVELWRVPLPTVGSLLAGIGAPLAIGRVRLADGAECAGFLCEAYATAGARDITEFGGWRAYASTLSTKEEA